MMSNVPSKLPQLHPLQRALKEGWRRLVVLKEIKQLYLATRCETDESRISRWLNPAEPDFPPFPQMARLIEAMQEWPGVEHHEPLEPFNTYFGCRVAGIQSVQQPLNDLVGLLGLKTGQVVQLFLQAITPESEGGRTVTANEAQALRPAVALLRRVADDVDDLLSRPGVAK